MKKLLKFLIIASIIILAAVIVILLINLYVVKKSEKYFTDLSSAKNINADCIIVLGAGLKPDGTPNYMLKDRLDYGIELYKNGAADKIIMSGDHGRTSYDEVNAMKKYAMDRGVPDAAIFMDHAGFSTYDSVYRAKSIFRAERPIIVTQKYHLYRAVFLARSLGLEAYGVSRDPYTYGMQYMRDIRELAARTKDFFYSIIKPRPKYLGEEIPINSNVGSVTND